MPRRLVMLSLLCAISSIATADDNAEEQKFSPEERGLVAIMDEFRRELEVHYAEAEKIRDPQHQLQFYKQRDPARRFVPRLLEYESKVRPTDAGLLALRQIVLLAAEGGAVDSQRDQGRREVLRRLPFYLDRPLVLETILYLGRGNFEPDTIAFLRDLPQMKGATAEVIAFSRLTLAQYLLDTKDAAEFIESRLSELAEGADERYAGEEDRLRSQHSLMPKTATLGQWEGDAIHILQQLANSKATFRRAKIDQLDSKGILLRVSLDPQEELPELSSQAKNKLFKELHLRIGKPAPDLNVRLLTGEDWSLSDQSDQVTIIQFSLKGCGPCEEMYPVLREMQQKYADRLAILSIMADRERKDVEEAVANGKLSWSIAWDGERGPLATRWDVRYFPTVYVVDSKGRIAGTDLRGDELSRKVEALIDRR